MSQSKDTEQANLEDVPEEEVEQWFEGEDEEQPGESKRRYASLEEKYTDTQLRVVRSTMDFSLHTLRGSLADSSYIKLSPDYQRRARWDLKKRSQLIESFLMNIPVPPVFLFENNYNQYEVMDGRQRLEAVWDFLNNRFTLKGLEFWTELEGLQFDDLPPTIQRGLLRRTVSAIVLLAETMQPDSTDVDVRMVLFRRLNTGGIKLNPQELRNALYPSAFASMLRKAARSETFTKLWGIPPRTPDEDETPPPRLLKNNLYRSMADCELVLRFFAIRETIVGGLKGSLKKLLDSCMHNHMNDDDRQAASLEALFHDALKSVDAALPGNPFKLPTTGRLSRPLYDALMVATSLRPNADPSRDPEGNSHRLNEALTDQQKYEVLIGRGNTIDAIRDRVQLADSILFP